jgi:hypothetical protein
VNVTGHIVPLVGGLLLLYQLVQLVGGLLLLYQLVQLVGGLLLLYQLVQLVGGLLLLYQLTHGHGAYYTKALITNKCTKRALSSVVTHSYMFRPCWGILRENFLLLLH